MNNKPKAISLVLVDGDEAAFKELATGIFVKETIDPTNEEPFYVTNGVSHKHLFRDAKGVLHKFCPKCLTCKCLDDFHKDSSAPSGATYYCKDCANLSSRKHHKNSRQDPAWVTARRQVQRENQRKNKASAVQYKGGKCEDCGGVFPDYIYDFHHLDNSVKSDNPSALLSKDWKRVKEEIDGCVLLCANCHRERHFGQA